MAPHEVVPICRAALLDRMAVLGQHGSVSTSLIGEAFAGASRVLVVRGSTFDPTRRSRQHVLADVRDAAALAQLQTALVASPTDAALMTPGDPTIVLLSGRTVLLTVLWVRPSFIRLMAPAAGDARLDDPEALLRWLAEHAPGA